MARQNADHGETRPVERDRLTQDAGIEPELPLPPAVGDDGHGLGARPVVFGQNGTADQRARAVAGEEIARDEQCAGAGGFAARDGGDAFANRKKREHIGESRPVIPEVAVGGVGERGAHLESAPGVAGAHAGVAVQLRVEPDPVDQAQLMRISDRHRAQEHRIQCRKDCGVDADTEREGDDGDAGEPRVLPQHPQAEANVLDHGLADTRAAAPAGIPHMHGTTS